MTSAASWSWWSRSRERSGVRIRLSKEEDMVRLLIIASLVCVALPAHAQQTIKIGMINVLSGQFADAGIQMENGARTYIKQHGDTLAGKKIEIIRRDVGGPLPDVAKRHAQELVVGGKVDLLAGFLLTSKALAPPG